MVPSNHARQSTPPPDMTVVEGSPCIAASTYDFTVAKLASFIKPELKMAPAPAAHSKPSDRPQTAVNKPSNSPVKAPEQPSNSLQTVPKQPLSSWS